MWHRCFHQWSHLSLTVLVRGQCYSHFIDEKREPCRDYMTLPAWQGCYMLFLWHLLFSKSSDFQRLPRPANSPYSWSRGLPDVPGHRVPLLRPRGHQTLLHGHGCPLVHDWSSHPFQRGPGCHCQMWVWLAFCDPHLKQPEGMALVTPLSWSKASLCSSELLGRMGVLNSFTMIAKQKVMIVFKVCTLILVCKWKQITQES